MSSFNTPGTVPTFSSELISEDEGFDNVAQETTLYQSETAQIIAQIPDAFQTKGGKQSESSIFELVTNYREGLLKAYDGLDLESISKLASQVRSTRESGNSIYIFGNGGSSSAATHFAADLGKIRFEDPNSYFRITSLSDNSALITATANDVGYSKVFAHQITRFVKPGDLVIAISSSGNSDNIIEGLLAGKLSKANTWAIVGFTGGVAAMVAENKIYIPTNVGEYGFMEDISSVIIHLLVTHIHQEDLKIFK